MPTLMFWILAVIIVVVLIYFFASASKGGNPQDRNTYNQLVNEFQKGFNRQQKAAIISSLIIVCKTAKGLLPKEEQFIEATARSLGISLSDSELITISKNGRVNLVAILNTLSNESKEWFVYTLYSILSFYGKPEGTKLEIALTILGDIGVSEKDFVRIVETTKEIHKRFMQ